jgi:transposase
MSKTFILELPLKTTPCQEKKLLVRFETARQVHNAVLGEGLKRLKLLRESKAFRRACKMPRGRNGKDATVTQKAQYKARVEAFRQADAAVGIRKYDLMSWATQFTHSWIRDHLGSQEVKAVTARVWTSVNRYRFGTDRPCKNGRRCKKPKETRRCDLCGKPRFKRYGQVRSVENITNLQGLRWRDKGNYVQWRDLEIPAVVDRDDPTHAHGLGCRVKYVRIILKVISGRNRFYAQLVLEGHPLQRHPTVDGAVVGLDIGPSTVAVVGEDDAFLVQFCAELEDIEHEIRILQRKLDRQRRANNPDCYDEKGRAIKDKRPRNKSKRMLKTEAKLAELQRRQAEYRKSLHGRLANRVLGMGNVVKTEKLSYRAFQRQYGRSVGKRAPGTFVEMLRRKTEGAGGRVEEFSTYRTRLSQICHGCGTIEKKPLSQRWHECECGIEAQRDLYSAFLARCVENDTLNADHAKESWSGAGPLLQMAFRDAKSANGRHKPSSFG